MKTLAHFFSAVLTPLLMPFYGICIIFFFSYLYILPISFKLFIASGVLFFTAIIPAMTILWMYKTKTKSFKEVDLIKRDILNLYKDDIVKYSGDDSIKVQSIFEEIPSQLQKHEKRFSFNSMQKDARYRDYKDAFFWLQESMIVNIAFNTTEPNIGLRLNRESSALKCYMGDTGLLLSLAFDEKGLVDEEIYRKILFNKLTFNEGMIMENIVAQMLTATGKKLYFYFNYDKQNSANNMEIDFLIAKNKITSKHNISPIEVKSGKNYTFSSLNKFKNKYKEYLSTAYVLHIEDLRVEDEIVFLPVYMTCLL